MMKRRSFKKEDNKREILKCGNVDNNETEQLRKSKKNERKLCVINL